MCLQGYVESRYPHNPYPDHTNNNLYIHRQRASGNISGYKFYPYYTPRIHTRYNSIKSYSKMFNTENLES